MFPALVTLAVTLARLAGELYNGSKALFNPQQGGAWAIVGIVWLVPIFGAYFGFRLAREGDRPAGIARGLVIGILGAMVFVAGFFLYQKVLQNFTGVILMWTLAALAGLLQIFVWRRLFKVLAAYAYSARVPVAIVMLAATFKNWPSHYNANIPGSSPWTGFLLFGFIPQLIWWASFTIVLGTIAGVISAALTKASGGSVPSSGV
ncbi:MAG: hypothetical protein ACM3NO_10315 [Deltaproteobacteria bacterium]